MNLKKLTALCSFFILAGFLFLTWHVGQADQPNMQAVAKESEQIQQHHHQKQNKHWIAAWSTSMQMPYSEGLSHQGFQDQTIRMVVHPHIDGQYVRIQLSNEYGRRPVTFEDVNIARSAGKGRIQKGTGHDVTFSGKLHVTLQPGQHVWSDPVKMSVQHGQNLTVSLYVPTETGPTTWHAHAMQSTYIAADNVSEQTSGSVFTRTVQSWFWLESIQVKKTPAVSGAIVTLGDSITDGLYSRLNENNRWPDVLAERIHQANPGYVKTVLNAGISGNRLLTDGPKVGESALHRLHHDVFAKNHVTDLVLLEGINDIRHHPYQYDADDIIAGMKKVIKRSHAHGIDVIGGTLLPYKHSSMYTEKGEQIRQAVNEWIRTSGAFDGYIDFAKALRDPEHPKQLLPQYDSGDHLHPSDAGYRKMAEVIDLSLFAEKEQAEIR